MGFQFRMFFAQLSLIGIVDSDIDATCADVSEEFIASHGTGALGICGEAEWLVIEPFARSAADNDPRTIETVCNDSL